MRSESSKVKTEESGNRTRTAFRRRAEATRKAKLRRFALEALEARELLAVLPAAAVSTPTLVSQSGGNYSSPSIAVDPTNQDNLVMVWTRIDPALTSQSVRVEGARSTNGGVTWTAFTPYTAKIDPSTASGTPALYAQVTDPQVAFDRSGNFHVVVAQHSADNNNGEIQYNKFRFSDGAVLTANVVLTSWLSSVTPVNRALKPTIAVDAGLASFTDPQVPTYTQTTAGAGNVYVAWATNDDAPSGASNWNPNAIRMRASFDNGATFGGVITVNAGGNGGSQRNTAPRIAVSQGTGSTPGGQVTVVWDDFGSGASASPPVDFIRVQRYAPVAGALTAVGGNVTAATTLVRGQQGYGGLTASAAQPLGIGPAPAIASDNTLGAFSQFQGRLYITYVGRFDNSNNPASNTDIYLITSDNGGASWSAPRRVNDDVGVTDGFSGADVTSATGTFAQGGRPQFMPSVAVDQATGTLVVTYSDTRFDAAQARVATMIATSIDGGATFGPQTFANTAQTAYDHATGQTVVLGPIPDNNSSGNAMTGKDGTFGFGDRQGLAVLGGKVYPAWSSNLNGGNDGLQLLRIRVGQATIAAGPRVVSGTMGPVGLTGDSVNGNRLPDGSPLVQSLIVEFDRRVDPSTFTPGSGTPNVTVFAANFESGLDGFTIDNAGPDGVVGTADDGLWHRSSGRGNNAGRSPTFGLYYGRNETSSGGGNYDTGSANSGVVTSPIINLPAGATLNLGLNYFLQTEGGAPSFDVARVSVFDVAAGTTTLIGDNSAGSLLADPSNGFRALSADISQFAGRQIRLVFSFDTVDEILNNFEGLYIDDVTITAIGTPGDVVIVARDVNGVPLPVQPVVTSITPLDANSLGATRFLVSFTAQSTPGTYSYTIGPDISDRIRRPGVSGNAMDQNGNARTNEVATDRFAAPRNTGSVPFQGPYDRDTLPLVVPGPHVVSTSVPGEPATADNLVLNKTVSSIDVTFDRDMDASTFEADGRDVLRIQGPAGVISGPFTVTQVSARTFRIGFPTQQLSGTYTITLGPEIRSASGLAIDANLNAGVDALRGVSNSAPVSLDFNSTGSVVIAPDRTVSSTILLTDNFVIQNLSLRLNITHANVPDLEARLIAPDGTSILLFSNVGATGTRANFNNTIFDDNAGTPIANGGPPFFGRFRPQQPLGALVGSSSVQGPGGLGAGVYTLQITNKGDVAGVLNNWTLTLGKPVSGTGLGELVADRTPLSFRIFTMDPTNPLASTTWTSVGPASIAASGGGSGRIGGIAVDPSDPSGNTVYVAGATGGVWKTNNFLTTDPNGPTYIPLTDFGPTLGINIGGIAVFGRNNDPNQSVVIVSTGDGDAGTPGVGFLRSTDGGATWTLLDSTNNNLPFAQRDHAFRNNTSYKVVVDPRPSPSGQAIIYAAMSGANGGIWRSVDTGNTWTRVRAGQATDVLLDPASGPVDAVANPTGNLQIVYAAFRGEGVYLSPNQGQVWSLMGGGIGKPLQQDPGAANTPPIPVQNQGATPNGAKGRIVLAKPALVPSTEPNAALKNLIYQGWLFAYVATPNDFQDGLYVTKDQGQNWTRIRIPGLAPINGAKRAVPSNDTGLADYDVLGDPAFQGQGNYDIAIAIDPNNPNIVYLGGFGSQPSGLVRVDITGLGDPHAYYLANDRPGNGTLTVNANDGPTMKQNPLPGVQGPIPFLNLYGDPRSTPAINLIRNPFNPLGGSSTYYTPNISSLNNSGAGARWVPIDSFMSGADVHRMTTIRDPLTGKSRLIIGNDHGMWSSVDNGDGTIDSGIGTAVAPAGNRNGNLQITQFYYGAVQPSSAAAQIAQALFYGQAQDDGFPRSSADVLNTGNIFWGFSARGDGTGVATDQTGSGTLYQYNWPCCGGNKTDFFLVNGVGRTFGLIQASGGGQVPDPQWPNTGGSNFAVNPINGNQIIISSQAGRIFRTQDQGQFWLVIGEPSALDGTYAPALAYGAPLPSDPTGALDNFIYAGTSGGRIFVTFTGGGANGNAWTNLSAGLDGSAVQSIVTNPTRGSREAYAVTRLGIYYMADSAAPNATWQNITGNVFQITHAPFGIQSFAANKLTALTSIIADWRYVIPDNPANPGGPTHPMLYVAGNGGVYRSTDKGQTWTLFPSPEPNSYYVSPNPAGPAGGLPNADVRDLDLSLGNIDPTNGRPVAQPGDPNILVATTFGRGMFAIRLAPVVFQSTLALSQTLPAPGGSDGGQNSSGQPLVTIPRPVFEGLSQQTAFGHVVRITLVDLTDPANPRIIGGYDPSDPTTDIAANRTDSAGRFAVQVKPGGFNTNGIKTIGIRATDASGTVGNLATFTFQLQSDFPNVNAPPVMPTLGMLPVDDTSGGLLITRIPNPRLTGVTDPSTAVAFYLADANGNPVGAPLSNGTSNTNGVYTFALPSLADGTYRVVAVASNSFGSSPPSPVLTFQIKTNAPTTKPTFGLLPADDTGLPLNNITSNHQPRFVGVTEANGRVQLFRVVNGVRVGAPIATTTADASGNYSIQLPFNLNNGTITLQVGVTDVAGNQGPYSDPTSVSIITVDGDYTGVGRTTPALFRRDPVGGGLWFAQGVTPAGGVAFGSSALDIPFTGDFDGDGIADRAVFRPSENRWFLQRTSAGAINFTLGDPGAIPVVGDIDGDSIIDVGVFNPTDGTWVFAGSTAGTVRINTPVVAPAPGDIPVPGNYNGVGGVEVAIYRPSTKQFFIQGFAQPILVTTGAAGVEDPVPGNYNDSFDPGTGVGYYNTAPAVYNRATGQWAILRPNGQVEVLNPTSFQAGDIPAPGDYDGSGRTQRAVYRPSAGTFIVVGTTGTVAFGTFGDIPLTSPLVYRDVVATTATVALANASDTGFKGDNVTSARRPVFSGTTAPNAIVDLIRVDPLNPANNVVVGSATANAQGSYSVGLSPNADLPNGTYTVQVRARNVGGALGPASSPLTIRLVTTEGDFNADGTSDLAVFRRVDPGRIDWFVRGASAVTFGAGGLDIPLAADFNGDGRLEPAIYRPSTAQWFARRPGVAGDLMTPNGFGWANVDIPVPADYNGDGITDIAVFRPLTSQTSGNGAGNWYIRNLDGTTTRIDAFAFALAGDIPVPGDYNGDGKDQPAFYRPSTQTWFILGPNGVSTVSFGGPNDIPVPGVYDVPGVGRKVQPAVFRPSTGQYFVLGPNGGRLQATFAPGDIPAPGDYNGDGLNDATVYRPSANRWFTSTLANPAVTPIDPAFGGPADVPPVAPYQYRLPNRTGGTVSLGSMTAGLSTAPAATAAPAVVTFDFATTARSLSAGNLAETPAPAEAPTDVFSRLPRGRRNRVVAPNLFAGRAPGVRF